MSAGRHESSMRFGPPLTPAVKSLLIVTCAAFLLISVVLEEMVSREAAVWVYFQLGLIPREVLSSLKLWQPFTYIFLHEDLSHVFWNMVTLWMFGAEIEGIWGRNRFLRLYFLSGVGGAVAMIIAKGNPTIGASGAVMGLVVAYGVLFADRPLSLLFPPITVKAKWLCLGWVVIDLIYFLKGPGSGVAYWAHIGGAITGFLFVRFGGLVRSRPSPTAGLSLRDRWKRYRARRHLKLIEKRDREFDKQGPTLH